MSDLVPVVSLTRECQYCWNGEFGRVRCGRLAHWYFTKTVGDSKQISFRCGPEHMLYHDNQPESTFKTLIDPGITFNLGYKP